MSLSPVEVAEEGGRCSVCGRRVTLGVMQRVDDLARRDVRVERGEDGLVRSEEGRPPFRSMVALDLILAEALGVGVKTKKVARVYGALVSELDNEMSVLLNAPVSDIARIAGERVAEGVDRVRRGLVEIVPGYDGRYGTVKIWGEGS